MTIIGKETVILSVNFELIFAQVVLSCTRKYQNYDDPGKISTKLHKAECAELFKYGSQKRSKASEIGLKFTARAICFQNRFKRYAYKYLYHST